MKIVVGSHSQYKERAVKSACSRLGLPTNNVVCINVTSGVNAQPVGFDETYRGALNRAKYAHGFDRFAFAVGIESGLFRSRNGGENPASVDMAVIVVIQPNGEQIVTTSPGFVFPEHYVTATRRRGFKTAKVGSLIAATLGGDPGDPHATLSHGAIKREDLLVEGLVVAFQQL
jgi:inosine/xanthosine triphosphatase